MQPIGKPSHRERTSYRITRVLGLCCFLVLLFGSSSHLHAPHFKDVKQTNQYFHTHTDQRSFAYLPELPRIRQETPKKLTGDSSYLTLEPPFDNALVNTYPLFQGTHPIRLASFTWLVLFIGQIGANRLPPTRAPPTGFTQKPK